MARPPAGGARAALRVPAEEDRASPRSARRLSHRLPQHRRGDPHRPLRGRSEGEADRALQADRSAGRGDPQPAAQVAVEARRGRDQGRARQAVEGAPRAEGAAQIRRCAVGADHGRSAPDPRELLQEDRHRPSPLELRGGPRDRHRSRTGADREGAHHRHPVRQGLDPGDEGAPRGHVEARVQAGRWPEARRQGDDDGQAAAARLQRQVLHPRGRSASRRPRARRTAAAHGRPGGEPRLRGDLRAPARPQAAGRRHLGPRLHRARGRDRGRHAQGQADPQRHRARGGSRLRSRRRRSGRHHRREPQAPDLQARRG